MLFTVQWQQASWFFFPPSIWGKVLSCLSFESPKSCLITRLMVLGTISISRVMIFCFRTGFRLILYLTVLITCGVQTTRAQPDQLWLLTPPESKKQCNGPPPYPSISLLLLLVPNFAFFYVQQYTMHPSIIRSSSYLSTLRLIVKYVVYLPFLIHPVHMTYPFVCLTW